MNKKTNEKKEFKKEYIRVIVSGIVLIVLIAALIFMVFYKGNLQLENVPNNSGHEVNELVIDVDEKKCSSTLIKSLSNEAQKVTMEYEENFKQYDNSEMFENYYTYDYFWKVNFKNMTDNFYLKITNNKNDHVITITKDTLVDGKWEFDTEVNDDVVTYTISLISNLDGCNEQVFRKFELKALIYNVWSSSSMCEAYKDFELCKRWISEDTVSLQNFMVRLEKYKKEHPELGKTNVFGVEDPAYSGTNNSNSTSTTTKNSGTNKSDSNKNTNDKDKNTSKNNLIYIITGAVIAIIVGGVVVILLRKKGSK